MCKRRSFGPRRGGFTLIEVLLVLVILVILASLVVVAIPRVQGKANINAAKSQIGMLESALDLYQLDVQQYPTTAQGLEALRVAPADLANPKLWGPTSYIDGPVPMDPWSRPYQYAYPGQRNVDKFDLWSLGPDGTDGTADDVGNWPDEVTTQ